MCIIHFVDRENQQAKQVKSNIYHARVAQLVEHDLAKVGVAGSSPVSRSLYCMEKPVFMQVFYFVRCSHLKAFESRHFKHSQSLCYQFICLLFRERIIDITEGGR